MSRIILEPVRNVPAAGVTATMYMTTTRVYPNTLEAVIFKFADTSANNLPITKAEISRIVVKLGSSTKPIWDVTGDELNAINRYEGRSDTPNVLTLPFSNIRSRTVEAQMLGALDFGQVGIREMTVEITCTPPAGSVPVITTWAEVSPPKLFGTGAVENQLFRALLRTPITFTGAVARFPQNIASAAQGGALLRRLHFFSPAYTVAAAPNNNIVTSYEMRRDGVAFHEDTPFDTQAGVLDEWGQNPQTNVYTFDAIMDDNESKALAQVRSDQGGLSLIPVQHLITTNAGGTIDTVADVFANINGL
jgi:Viral coat protein P2 N-terminal domain